MNFVHFMAKKQNASTKFQKKSKFQISMTKTLIRIFNRLSWFWIFLFGHWILFVFCDLVFVFSRLSGL